MLSTIRRSSTSNLNSLARHAVAGSDSAAAEVPTDECLSDIKENRRYQCANDHILPLKRTIGQDLVYRPEQNGEEEQRDREIESGQKQRTDRQRIQVAGENRQAGAHGERNNQQKAKSPHQSKACDTGANQTGQDCTASSRLCSARPASRRIRPMRSRSR